MLGFIAHPYQQAALQAIARSRRDGQNRALVVMATGLGKTVVSALDVQRFLKTNGGRVLYLCHQNDILEQARQTYESVLGLGYSYSYFNGRERSLEEADCVFASLQMMSGWRQAFFPGEFSYVVVDESHHSHAPTYRPTLEYFQPKFMLGITATPDRSDLKDIRRIYGPEAFNLSIEDALAEGLLTKVDYRLMADEIQNLASFKSSAGRISIRALNRSIFVPRRDEEIIKLIEARVKGIANPRIIIFVPSIAYAEHLSKLMPGAMPIHSLMSQRRQQLRLKAFRTSKIHALITIDKFNEGIDLPDANVLVFLRSTSSRTIFLQQLGRGLRISPGKDQVLVLDFVANCQRLEMVQDLWKKVDAVYQRRGLAHEAPISVKVGSVHFDEVIMDVLKILATIRTGYTREVLVKQIQDLEQELGRTPRSVDVDVASKQGKCATVGTFYNYFGTFQEALKQAGFRSTHTRYTREEFLEQLRSLAKELGHTPSYKEVYEAHKAGKAPSQASFQRRFGPLYNALLEAGLNVDNWKSQHRTDELLLKQLKRVGAEAGRPLRARDIREACAAGKCADPYTFRKRFGTLQIALELAGLVSTPRKTYTNRELLQQISDVKAQIGRVPRLEDMRQASKTGKIASSTVFYKKFGTFSNALRTAGMKPNVGPRPVRTNQEMLADLVSLARRLGKVPSSDDIDTANKKGLCASSPVYGKRFGSMNQARKAAGISQLFYSQRGRTA